MHQNMILICVVGLILIGCSPGAVSNTGAGDYLVTIWASNHCVQRGALVHLHASVVNKRSTIEVIELKDKPVLDILVVNGEGSKRWSDGKSLTPDLTRLELQPNQSKTIDMDWVAESNTSVGIVSAIFFYSNEASANQVARVSIYLEPACPGPLGP